MPEGTMRSQRIQCQYRVVEGINVASVAQLSVAQLRVDGTDYSRIGGNVISVHPSKIKSPSDLSTRRKLLGFSLS